LLSSQQFDALVSGRRRGTGPALLRSALRLAETPYTLAVSWRNHRYDTGRAETVRTPVPVVSVGNLTLGGTGKTPMVEWLARWFRSHRVRVTLISRGYGAERGAQNDEALELEQRLPDVPHLQNPDRAAAAATAIEEFACQLILLDDGFQHRRLARDLDIVLLDASEPFGYRHVFPRGLLREPIHGVRRAQVIVLSRADMVDPSQRAGIWAEVAHYAPEAARIEVRHAPRGLLSASGTEEPTAALAGHAVAAFCGIGNPSGFRHTLAACGFELAAFRAFPDHHAYSREDIQTLGRWADEHDVRAVLCTHKDLVKIGLEHLGRRPLWALTIGLEIMSGQPDLEARLRPLLERIPPDA
jgi:tetraacyldisaccharide 4'-kinase